MKREALRHPKMLDLAGRLRIPREHAIGIVSTLLDWVADMAPQGDVGKWPDGAIAVACGWSGDPAEFINHLCGAGWLDRHPEHRLLVHDYPDHAERFVKAKLAKDNKWFCLAYYQTGRKWNSPNLPNPTATASTDDTTEPTTERSGPRDQTKPYRSDPIRSEEIFNQNETLRAAACLRVLPMPLTSKLKGSVFDPIQEDYLENTQALVEWHRRQLSAASPVVGDTEAHLLLVLAAGLSASRMSKASVKKNRVSVFAGTVKRRKWQAVLGYVEEARERLDRWRAEQRKEVPHVEASCQ